MIEIHFAMSPEERIRHFKNRIIEFEKFDGPIARAMIDLYKRAIDRIRADLRS